MSLYLPQMKSTVSLPSVELDMPEIQSSALSINGVPARYGIYTDTLINVNSAGKMDIINGSGRIWRLRISCRDARSIQVMFSKFHIPARARLFLYDDEMKSISGAFTNRNMRPDSTFSIADFQGNNVIVEYFEPVDAEFEGKVIIRSIGQAFRDPVYPQAGPGFININCPIGKDAQLAKHAVSKMSFRSGNFQVTCTGALINNTESDGTPYFLTAHHCISTQEEAGSLITHFNYEAAGCDGELGTAPTLSGSTLLATGQPSDFTLLVLDDIPPPEYQPYYAGWDVNGKPVAHVTGIHIPFNETKKISIDFDSIISNTVTVRWDDNSRSPQESHWIVGFDNGGTSQGSSGSPLFNSSNQIIGQLHGGDDERAYYGKLSYSYNYKAPNYHTMSHYLDTDSTGIKSMHGYEPSDNYPDAFISTKFERVCQLTPITFDDYSVFGPYKRKWEIFPSTFVFSGGTSDSSANPIIEFLQDTIYSVKLNLKVKDTVRSVETLKIIAGNSLNVNISSNSPKELCECDFESIDLTAVGGDEFKWSIVPGDENKITLSDTSGEKVKVFRKHDFETAESYSIGLRLIGSQATCSDTVTVSYNLIRQVNDNVKDAIELEYGISDFYSNICATVEEGEPIPPFESCTTQDSWCDEYGTGEDIVENSVWFKFVASSTGKVSISSTGMDNQIALYEADSYLDIITGNYTLLGANDDRSSNDYRPLLISETVIPGKTYWLQVDGSGGGLEDNFYINIIELTETGTDDAVTQKISVYPQPANDQVFMSHSDWINESSAEIALFNTSGMLISNSVTEVWDGTITVNISGWPAGVYIATVKTQSKRYVGQIVKR